MWVNQSVTYVGELDPGIRLKATPNGCITMIQSSFDDDEYRRLTKMTFKHDKVKFHDKVKSMEFTTSNIELSAIKEK